MSKSEKTKEQEQEIANAMSDWLERLKWIRTRMVAVYEETNTKVDKMKMYEYNKRKTTTTEGSDQGNPKGSKEV